MEESEAKYLTCLIIEEERLFLDLLSSMLSLRGGLRVVAERPVGHAVREACREHKPDILILSLSFLRSDCESILADFDASTAGGHVIVITPRASSLPGNLGARASAVVRRDAPFSHLRQAVDGIIGRYQPLHPRHDEAFAEKPLSLREAEIFTFIGEGLTNREIASRLSLSVHTVQAHRRRISVKLGTRRSELSQRAIAARRVFLDPVS
jgi:DNA-binding NarL/FixJ family response regulator